MCTASVVSPKISLNNMPLLFKHRDVSSATYCHPGNKLVYQDSKRYGKNGIISIIDSSLRDMRHYSLCGMNRAGLSIINTATYNLGQRNFKIQEAPSQFMNRVLKECDSVSDFERLLQNTKHRLVPSNFGVTDAEATVYYYEVCDRSYVSKDVDFIPEKHITFTNFSLSGDKASRPGLERYNTANMVINGYLAGHDKITPRILFDNISRSLRSDFLNIDLKKIENPFGNYFFDGAFIPLRTTTFSVVFEGNVIWTLLGYPPTGIVIPVVIGRDMPWFMSGKVGITAAICDKSLKLKEYVFDINVGEGNKYFNVERLYNSCGDGFIQRISDLEDWMYTRFTPLFSNTELADFYEEYYLKIVELYDLFFSQKKIQDDYEFYRLCAMDTRTDIEIACKQRIFKRIVNLFLK